MRPKRYLGFRKLSPAGLLLSLDQKILDKMVGGKEESGVHVTQALSNDLHVVLNEVLLRRGHLELQTKKRFHFLVA